MADCANQSVADGRDLFGQRRDDRDDIGQPGKPHRGPGQRNAETRGGGGSTERPRHQQSVIAGQGQRVPMVRGPGPGLSLRGGDDIGKVSVRSMRGDGDHHPGNRTVDDGVDHTGNGAHRIEHPLGNGVGVRAGKPSDFDPIPPAVLAATPGWRAAHRLNRHRSRRAHSGANPGQGVEHRLAGTGSGGAPDQCGCTGQTGDRRRRRDGQVQPCRGGPNRGPEQCPEPRQVRPWNHHVTVPAGPQ